jgi:hypothetical protein
MLYTLNFLIDPDASQAPTIHFSCLAYLSQMLQNPVLALRILYNKLGIVNPLLQHLLKTCLIKDNPFNYPPIQHALQNLSPVEANLSFAKE